MPKGIYIKTLAHRENLRKSNMGKKQSPKTCEKKRLLSLGRKHSEETKRKMREARAKQKPPTLGKRHSEETKIKMSLWKRPVGRKASTKTKEKISERMKGSGNPRYIKDRSLIQNKRESYEYSEWRRQIYSRDMWKCKISNKDCNGRIEAHHILNWVDYPELRYDINNGITLCHKHHPLKWREEERMIPAFKELIK